MKVLKEFLQREGIAHDHPDAVSLQQLLQHNVGYLQLFARFRFKDQVSMPMLRQLFNDIQHNRNNLNELPTQVALYTDYYELRVDIQQLVQKTAVRKFIQNCPSELKKTLRANTDRWNLIEANCVAFNELDVNKRRNFTRTISRYKNLADINNALKRFIEYVNKDADPATIIEQARSTIGAHIRLVDVDNNVIVVRTSTKKAMKVLGKGSGWCIADRYQEMQWDTYIRNCNDIQYILFDFNYSVSNKHHRIGITNQNGYVKHVHANNNDCITQFEQHCTTRPYLDYNCFKEADNESKAEDVVDEIRSNNTIRYSQMLQLTQLGHLDKLFNISNMSANKTAKTFGRLLLENGDNIDDESIRHALRKVHNIIGSTKFFNELIPVLHRLDVDTAQQLQQQQLELKYDVHLKQIIERYFVNVKAEKQSSIVTIDGIKYNKVTTLTPINMLSYDVFDCIVATNPAAVTNKILQLANDIGNDDLFNILLKHFGGNVQKQHGYKSKYKILINEKMAQV